jgi:hypothetical protein
MERSPWGRAFGEDLRKWPVGCRMGGARFVLGVHAACDKTRTGRRLGRTGRKGGGELSKMPADRSFVRASVGSRGGHLGQQCAIEKKSGKGCPFFRGDLRF